MSNTTASTPKPTTTQGQTMSEPLRSWMMVGLTTIFVVLYILALVGVLGPLTDDRLVGRLEPILFVIIGYYFGRLPAQQNEQTLKQEIDRQTAKADTAEQATQQLNGLQQAMQEKLKNTHAVLKAAEPTPEQAGVPGVLSDERGTLPPDSDLRQTVAVALRVLES